MIKNLDLPLAPARKILLQRTNLAVIVLVTLLSFLRLLLSEFEEVPAPGIIVAIGCLANLIFLKRGGSVTFSSWVLAVLLLFGLAAGGYNSYGFSGPAMLLSPLIPIFMMLLMGPRVAYVSLILLFFIFLGIICFELLGIIPVNPHPQTMVVFSRFTAIFSVCLISTWLVWRFSVTINSLLVSVDEQSKTDYLTGILNRRGIQYFLEKEVARARRTGTWLSVIMIDIDHFKLFNDINGHQAGDECLVNIGKEIDSCFHRPADTVGRYGGEEFLVILPETELSGAQSVAEIIRCRISARGIQYGADQLTSVTVTLGVASGCGFGIESAETLINVADKALYQGKKQGRNCVIASEALR